MARCNQWRLLFAVRNIRAQPRSDLAATCDFHRQCSGSCSDGLRVACPASSQNARALTLTKQVVRASFRHKMRIAIRRSWSYCRPLLHKELGTMSRIVYQDFDEFADD